MTKRMELQGQRFGRLTVVSPQERGWECRCDCGKVLKVATSRLTTGLSTSCGCATPLSVSKVDAETLALSIIVLLKKGPLSSRQIAEHLGIPKQSIIGLMNGLFRKNMIENTQRDMKKANQWKALVEPIEVARYFKKEPKIPQVSVSGEEVIGITPEDQQWMQHYRTQWKNRYLRAGLKPPSFARYG